MVDLILQQSQSQEEGKEFDLGDKQVMPSKIRVGRQLKEIQPTDKSVQMIQLEN
nr:hypothetical protein [Lysinibacillus sphaericus]